MQYIMNMKCWVKTLSDFCYYNLQTITLVLEMKKRCFHLRETTQQSDNENIHHPEFWEPNAWSTIDWCVYAVNFSHHLFELCSSLVLSIFLFPPEIESRKSWAMINRENIESRLIPIHNKMNKLNITWLNTYYDAYTFHTCVLFYAAAVLLVLLQ